MADISKISPDKGVTIYDVKDATARSSISTLNSKIGATNGIAELDSAGKVPSSQLPSYVDDVLEYASTSAFPATGETGKIYVALDTNKTYRWSGSAYVEISESLALGETSSTAYAGNKGKANADAIDAIKDGTNIDSFGDVETALADKVDKVSGKGLSTNDYTDADKAKVDGAFPRSEQAVLGAKNLNVYPYHQVSKTLYDITYTVGDDGIIDVNGTSTAESQFDIHTLGELSNLEHDVEYILSGAPDVEYDVADVKLRLITFKDDNTGRVNYDCPQGGEIRFTIPTGHHFHALVYSIQGNKTLNHVKVKPMIRLASDTDDTYAPYAMTNRELTEKAQGIINAAVNAADFAAFKTAIGNL